ncbi:hypothetical protein MCP1_600005 [Candidatus Terasakiella magnetica]|nr:hypothetical protein MCP1_600005 [Candidatus Terasakiella magnetica]
MQDDDYLLDKMVEVGFKGQQVTLREVIAMAVAATRPAASRRNPPPSMPQTVPQHPMLPTR